MFNSKIIEILTRLMILKYITDTGTETIKDHKKTAYEKVINGIKRLPQNAMTASDIYDNVEGVGKSIKFSLIQMFQIDDPIRTGIPDLDNLLLTNIDLFNKIAVMTVLIQVHGIGIKRAFMLYDRGIRSPSEITGNILSPSILNEQSIQYPNDEKRISYEKITNFGRNFADLVKDLDISFTIAGSYRRKMRDSGDIDMVVFSKYGQINIEQTMEIVLQRLRERRVLINTVTTGKSRPTYTLYLDNENPNVQIDFLKIYGPEEYPYGLLYFTGSREFNIGMKTYAKRFGFTIGNTEMVDKNGNKVIVNSEEEIFSFFRIPYIPPENRIQFPYK